MKYAGLVRYWTNPVDLPTESGDKGAQRTTCQSTVEFISVFHSSQLERHEGDCAERDAVDSEWGEAGLGNDPEEEGDRPVAGDCRHHHANDGRWRDPRPVGDCPGDREEAGTGDHRDAEEEREAGCINSLHSAGEAC